MILGGVIASTRNTEDSTYIEVLQKPLNYRGIPEDTDVSFGRFLVVSTGYLDTAIYSPGRYLTAAGEVIGVRAGTLGEIEYRYPLIKGSELHIIERSTYPSISLGIGIFKGF